LLSVCRVKAVYSFPFLALFLGMITDISNNDHCHTKFVTAEFANRHLSSWTLASVELFHLEMLESSTMLILIQKLDQVWF